jgi:hypothetical protein
VRAAVFVGIVAAAASAARADDDVAAAPSTSDTPTVTGDVRLGWRFLRNEGDGRFRQDEGLRDGARIFDVDVLARDPRESASIDEMEARLSGIGDPWSDCLLALRRRGVFEASGGFRRDHLDYRASGDPFPYDVVRDRTFAHARWTPDRDIALRFAWDRSVRRGEAGTYGFAGGAINDSRPQRRTISRESDRLTLGADYAVGIWRFGLSQTAAFEHVDDSRFFLRPLHEGTLQRWKSQTYATTAKAGATLLDGDLDATLFVTRARTALAEHATGLEPGSGAPFPFESRGRLTREALDARFETSWRPHRDWEFTVAGESDDTVDDERALLRPLFAAGNRAQPLARVADRTQRWSADATWQASKEVRLRLGEQYLREELFVPTETHFGVAPGAPDVNRTNFASTDLRTTAGVDWDPWKSLSASTLAHFSSSDEPQTTAVPDRGTDWTTRIRWKPTSALTSTTVWRRTLAAHTGAVPFVRLGTSSRDGETTDLDAATRASSVSESVAWTSGPWSVAGTLTYQRLDTTADTAFGGGELVLTTVGFRGRNVIASVDVRHELTKTLRVFADVARTSATGDYAARWINASVGAEHDLRADLTLGVTLATWRLADRDTPQDGYRVYGGEVALTYRF